MRRCPLPLLWVKASPTPRVRDVQGGGRTTTGTVIGSLLRMFLNGASLAHADDDLSRAASLEHLDEDVGGASPRHRCRRLHAPVISCMAMAWRSAEVRQCTCAGLLLCAGVCPKGELCSCLQL